MNKNKKGTLYYFDINIRLILNDLWLSNPAVSVCCSRRIIKNKKITEQHNTCWKSQMCLMLQKKIQLQKSRIIPSICLNKSIYCTDEWTFGRRHNNFLFGMSSQKQKNLSQLFIKIKIWSPPKNTKWVKNILQVILRYLWPPKSTCDEFMNWNVRELHRKWQKKRDVRRKERSQCGKRWNKIHKAG